ncbi:CobW family GTP-binding protein [Georgenia satyanarayanai]|uniref:CobW family GTP-binding protein n=1 Tax=Georgenia satyanarayanai TaxID=860221 RepID=UPI00126427F2|nr:GTP-binding protein [Georgenia satyanarayanai]
MPRPVPVIALTGYLGAGKTSLLNHVLRQPGARVGVVVNDFGDLNVDAGLVTGQVDEPAAITGGCLCCLSDTDELDSALERLASPRLRLDAIIVEASGLADPATLARLIRFSGTDGVRPGGIVDVVDAVRHHETVDRDPRPPARYGVASLVVVNKLDQLPAAERDAAVDAVASRVHQLNPRAHVVGAVGGRIDPGLLYDVADPAEDPGQLPLRELLLADTGSHPHVHADSVTVTAPGGADPARVVALLEDPPPGVYRMKGTVTVRPGTVWRSYTVNVVGHSLHVASSRHAAPGSELVAIGLHLDGEAVRAALTAAVAPVDGTPPAAGFRRLQRYRRLSL